MKRRRRRRKRKKVGMFPLLKNARSARSDAKEKRNEMKRKETGGGEHECTLYGVTVTGGGGSRIE